MRYLYFFLLSIILVSCSIPLKEEIEEILEDFVHEEFSPDF
jgi:hypothetical protein